jgi:Cu-Zn family superoxide dismutase
VILMPIQTRQRTFLFTMLAAATTTLAACAPDAEDDPVFQGDNREPAVLPDGSPLAPEVAGNDRGAANIDVAQAAPDGARRGDGSAAGGLAGNWAETGENLLARADLLPTEGHTGHGTVTFKRAPDGSAVLVNVSLFGLEAGEHGFHVHENGACSGPDAGGAGGHYNPTGAPHGGPDTPSDEHHLGDLGNITADDQGIIEDTLESADLMRNGELAVLGRAIVVHSGSDDLESQPSGESGDPAACGVIRSGAEISSEEGGRPAERAPSQVQREQDETQRNPVG